MVARGEVVLNLTFGPSRSPYASRALSYAREHADETTEVERGVWRVSFRLGVEESRYGEAIQLLYMVGTWKTTVVEIDGSPEDRRIAQWMAHCAREWVRRDGSCRERFPDPRGWAKCRCCPLYDPEWAQESWVRPEVAFPSFEPGAENIAIEIPDHLPEDWDER